MKHSPDIDMQYGQEPASGILTFLLWTRLVPLNAEKENIQLLKLQFVPNMYLQKFLAQNIN